MIQVRNCQRSALWFVLLVAGCAASTEADPVTQADQPLYGLGSIATPWPYGWVPVCFQNGTGDRPDLQAKVRWILEDSWAKHANVHFTDFGACPGGGYHVSVQFADGSNGFTSSFGMGTPSVTLIANDADGRHFRYEVIHEFGHALGFVHEQERPDNWDKNGNPINCSQLDRGKKAAPGGTYYTAQYDSASVMNYCAGWVQALSAGDIAGVQAAYGLPQLRNPNDILWQYTNGQLAIWLMSGAAIGGQTYPGLVDSSWQIQGTGDFDGDGESDILWRHTSGQVAIWFMKNGALAGAAYPGGQDTGWFWKIQTVGDFDGDGRADILWRDANGQLAIWFKGDIAGAAYPGYSNYPYPVDLSWRVEGAGDFDGDGHADILWRHTNGQVAIWFMSGGTRVGEAYPGGQDQGHVWNIQGTGDFDGDGASDILWRDINGQLAIWFRADMNRAAYPSYRNAGGPVPLSWSVQGVGDFDGDGLSDILWRDASGQVAIWEMAGGLFSGDIYPGLVDNGWQIKGVFGYR